MSEKFERLSATPEFDVRLAALAGAAEGATRMTPADRIVRRGRQRNRRRWATGTVLSAAVVGTAVFAGVNVLPAQKTGAVTANPSATATVTSAPTLSASPSVAPTVPATAPAAVIPPGSANALLAVPGDPGQYRAAVWLKAGELPLGAQADWTPDRNVIGTLLGGSVHKVSDSALQGDLEAEFGCNPGGDLVLAADGSQVEAFDPAQNVNAFPEGGVSQAVFFFKDAATAEAGWQRLQNSFQTCSARLDDWVDPSVGAPVDHTATRTYSTGDSAVWSTVTGPDPACSDGCLQFRDYFVLRGNMIDYIGVQLSPRSGPVTISPPDADILHTMNTRLDQAYSAG